MQLSRNASSRTMNLLTYALVAGIPAIANANLPHPGEYKPKSYGKQSCRVSTFESQVGNPAFRKTKFGTMKRKRK